MTLNANELPFDVLCIIFEHCVKFDCPPAPLERLLLVCRSWFGAASSFPWLWCQYRIEIYSLKQLHYWTRCIPQRLARCLPDMPLDIYIHAKDMLPSNPLYAYDALLVQLSGEVGEYARRWRRLTLRGTVVPAIDQVYTRCLRFPTPNLQELVCDALRGDVTILPEIPSLRTFHVDKLYIPKYPDLRSVADLSISAGWHGTFDNAGLAGAVNVVKMRLTFWKSFKLSATYSKLDTLQIDGPISADCLNDFYAPRLQTIILNVTYGKEYFYIVGCKGIKVDKLSSAHLNWRIPGYRAIQGTADYVRGLRHFLTNTTGLKTLETESTVLACLALRILIEECAGIHQYIVLRLLPYRNHILEVELGTGEGGLESLRQFKGYIEYVENCSWDDFIGHVCQRSNPTHYLWDSTDY